MNTNIGPEDVPTARCEPSGENASVVGSAVKSVVMLEVGVSDVLLTLNICTRGGCDEDPTARTLPSAEAAIALGENSTFCDDDFSLASDLYASIVDPVVTQVVPSEAVAIPWGCPDVEALVPRNVCGRIRRLVRVRQ